MRTKKAKKVVNKEGAREYAIKEAISYSEKSGRANKISTAKAKGAYTITDGINGTAFINRFIFSLISKGRKRIPANEFISKLSEYAKGEKAISLTKKANAYLKAEKPADKFKPYNNLETYISRISGDVKKGYTVSFSYGD
jgi:hypothetical protein